MTCSPERDHFFAVYVSKTTLPVAAPGDAFMPLAISFFATPSSKRGNISCDSCAPVTRVSASSMSMMPSSTSCVATRNAAAAVRLPMRVCSIQSLPDSMVNSMSQRSW